jgi:hypothetical protein
LRPFVGKCAYCGKVDVRIFAHGTHCTDCKAAFCFFIWRGMSGAEFLDKCRRFGIDVIQLLGRPDNFWTRVDLAKWGIGVDLPELEADAANDILENLREQVCLDIDKEILQELQQASNWR